MARTFKQDYTPAIAEYHAGASVHALSKKYGIARTSMINVLSRVGGIHDRKDHDCRVKINVDEAVSMYAQGMRMKDISKKFNCTEGAVSLALKNRGVSARGRHQLIDSIFPVMSDMHIPDIKPQEVNRALCEFREDYVGELLLEAYPQDFGEFDDFDSMEEDIIDIGNYDELDY